MDVESIEQTQMPHFITQCCSVNPVPMLTCIHSPTAQYFMSCTHTQRVSWFSFSTVWLVTLNIYTARRSMSLHASDLHFLWAPITLTEGLTGSCEYNSHLFWCLTSRAELTTAPFSGTISTFSFYLYTGLHKRLNTEGSLNETENYDGYALSNLEWVTEIWSDWKSEPTIFNCQLCYDQSIWTSWILMIIFWSKQEKRKEKQQQGMQPEKLWDPPRISIGLSYSLSTNRIKPRLWCILLTLFCRNKYCMAILTLLTPQ